MVSYAFQRSIQYCQIGKGWEPLSAVIVPLLVTLLPHLHKIYTGYHANHTQIFLMNKAHEPLRTVRHNDLNNPWTRGSTKWGRKTLIYTCIYINLPFSFFLWKQVNTDTWDESQNSQGTDFNCRLQNQVFFSF